MKKSILGSVGVAALVFMAVAGFAAETTAENVTDKTLATLETPPNSPTGEPKKDMQDTLKKDDFVASETQGAPVATVSNVEKR